MTLIINGIDFDKRIDDAKRQLHDEIRWMWLAHHVLSVFNQTGILLKFTETDGLFGVPSEVSESIKLLYKPKNTTES